MARMLGLSRSSENVFARSRTAAAEGRCSESHAVKVQRKLPKSWMAKARASVPGTMPRCHRDERSVEQRREHETLRVHAAAHHVQHAHASHEQAEQPEVALALLPQGG